MSPNGSGASGVRRRACVIIPVLDNSAGLQPLLRTLALAIDPADAVWIISVSALQDEVRTVCEVHNASLNLRWTLSGADGGLWEISDWGIRNLREAGMDVLLLSQRAGLTDGALQEMRSVLNLHERHGLVVPRTNDETITSMPYCAGGTDPADAYELWKRIHPSLNRYQIVPSAPDFCVLINGAVLDRFDLMEAADAPINSAVEDFLCHINSCGYSALMANRAFVFHSEPPGTAHTAGDDSKFSEYLRFQADPVDIFAGLQRPHRPRLLFDLYHLSAHHSGTSEFALSLLRELARIVHDKWDLHIRVGGNYPFFANELAGYQLYQDASASRTVFDLAFRPSQIFTWCEFCDLNRLSPRLALTLLDIISVRCDYLSSPKLQLLVRAQGELCDSVFPISEFSRSDFAAFYQLDVPMQVIRPGAIAGTAPSYEIKETYILVVGNRYAHKGVAAAVKAIGTEWPISVLGGSDALFPSNVQCLESGNLTRRRLYDIFAEATLVVYPSHYEGYGLPVVDSLAMGKRLIVLDSEVNRELAAVTKDPNLHLINSYRELKTIVSQLWGQAGTTEQRPHRSWRDAAEQYAIAFDNLLNADIDATKLRRRWQVLRLLESSWPES